MRHAHLIILLILAIALTSYAQSAESACPKFSVLGPSGITQPGEDVYFTLQFEGDFNPYKVDLEWKVENGQLMEGQGTSTIRVASSKHGGEDIKAVVVLKGMREGCETEASETAPIAPLPHGQPVDTYGDLPLEMELSRLDTFFIELINNPPSTGFIVIGVGSDGELVQGKERMIRIINHAKFRKFDKALLNFGILKAEGTRTVLWRVPEGAELPSCRECEIVEGRSQ